MELRCDSGRLHGYVIEASGILEVSCRSTRCGKKIGVVVVHRFNLSSGQVISTRLYSEPRKEFEWQSMPLRHSHLGLGISS
jgi:hypothetical protein